MRFDRFIDFSIPFRNDSILFCRVTFLLFLFLIFLLSCSSSSLDRFFFSLDLGSAPSPFPYLLPTNAEAFSLSGENLYILFTSLPFIYIGIALTIKRLRSLNWPLYSSILFFIPFVNLLFFCLLSILPKTEIGLNSKVKKWPGKWSGKDLGVGDGFE